MLNPSAWMVCMALRETVGKLSTDLLNKNDANDHSVIEQMQENVKDYEKHMEDAISNAKKHYPNNTFYISVITKKERLMQNVLRNYFIPLQACPTPTYDQTVYRYTVSCDALEYLWVVPSKDTCKYLREFALEVVPEERALLQNVLDFYDGTLLKLAKKCNGEVDETPELELFRL